jgi:pimeloyl-ACP methyl ester carboxylesterase
MSNKIKDFRYERVEVADDVRLNVAIGGTGSPIVLLHGFPQTHLMWRHVAPLLAADHTVICPDLRGYGESSKPLAATPETYSKRTMAADVVTLAATLGFDHFALAGHDRGALVAFRAGLDHPDTITHLACLDIVPTLDTWNVLNGVTAAVAFHLFLMAQPPTLPETLIANSAPEFFAHFLDAWATDQNAIPSDIRAEYLRASSTAVPSIVADFRASAGIDLEHDRSARSAGDQLRMPVAVIQQDWGTHLSYDAEAVWRAWAPNLTHHKVSSGHFMAESTPNDITTFLRTLLSR